MLALRRACQKQRCWCKRSEEAVILSQIGSIATYARLQPGFLLAAKSRRPALRLVLERPSQVGLEPSSSWLVLAPRSRVVSGVQCQRTKCIPGFGHTVRPDELPPRHRPR